MHVTCTNQTYVTVTSMPLCICQNVLEGYLIQFLHV